MPKKRKLKLTISAVSLIIANLIPIFGFLFAGWTFFGLMLSYSLENVVIGFYTILKIISARGLVTLKMKPSDPNFGKTLIFEIIFLKVFPVFFFTVHFGLFCVGHIFLIFRLLGWQTDYSAIFSELYQILPFLLVLMISHGISFFSNYVRKKEYREAEIIPLMAYPYPRVLLMHFLILLIAYIMSSFGGVLLWIVLIIVKTSIDFIMHQAMHGWNGRK